MGVRGTLAAMTTTARPAPEHAGTHRLSTRELLSCAAIGVAVSVVVVPAVWWQAATVAVAPFLSLILAGAAITAPVISQRLMRRGGVAVLTTTVMGVVTATLTPRGPGALIPLILLGLLLEVPFAVTRYRRFAAWRWYAVALVLAALQVLSTWVVLDIGSLAVPAQVATVVSGVVSMLFFTWLGLRLAAALERAGVRL